jgi:hypothetical protein
MPSDPEQLKQTIFAFIQAETWEESRRILEAHPELLTDEADAVLRQLIDTAQAQGDEAAIRIFERHRALLRRCREVGIEQAFAELSGPPIPPEFQADLRRAQEGEARYRQTGDLVRSAFDLYYPVLFEQLGRPKPESREDGQELTRYLARGL